LSLLSKLRLRWNPLLFPLTLPLRLLMLLLRPLLLTLLLPPSNRQAAQKNRPSGRFFFVCTQPKAMTKFRQQTLTSPTEELYFHRKITVSHCFTVKSKLARILHKVSH